MSKKQGIRAAVMAAFLAASGVSGVAYAVDEVEPNYPIQGAQGLVVDQSGVVTVYGVIGAATGLRVNDVDFYSFYANANDELQFDIDGAQGGSGNVVDTILYVFGPGPAYPVLAVNDDVSPRQTPDEGSIGQNFWLDSLIPSFKVDKAGIYTVGVTGYRRKLGPGGTIIDVTGATNTNGRYTLIIRGLTPLVQKINIDIKPGSGEFAPVNPKAKGNIPVALLSSSEFDALLVEPKSLRFGSTGDEESWLRCNKGGADVNGDGRLDLVCHFENQAARFDPSNEMATIKGNMLNGTPFEGSGLLKIVPVKRQSE